MGELDGVVGLSLTAGDFAFTYAILVAQEFGATPHVLQTFVAAVMGKTALEQGDIL